MKRLVFLFLILSLICSCGRSRPKPRPITEEVKRYSYRVTAQYPHLTSSYTQGLQFTDGVMWEGTGEYGHSVLQTVDLESGRADVLARLPREEFGEGITVLGDRIYQLTWQNRLVHIYDRRTMKEIETKRYKGEGWGLTSDGETLYMSDGTDRIRKIDPATFEQTGSIGVTLSGESLSYLNELEWIDGKIWANVYTFNQIVIIDPESGIAEGLVDLRGLLPDEERTETTDVLNGIAYDSERNRIFVTGKNWSLLFQIELVEQ